MGFLQGKRALITGVASQRSIASGIAEAMHREGAQLAFTYQNEKLKSRVGRRREGVRQRHRAFRSTSPTTRRSQRASSSWASTGTRSTSSCTRSPTRRAKRSKANSSTASRARTANIAHDISAYSLAAMAKAARPMMADRNGAIVTLSYLGAERALANYNVMGVAKASLEATVRYLALNLGPEGTRVNAISAGPIKTLAAAGIANFRKMLGHVEAYAPLRRSVTIEDVGNVAAFLCSDLAAGVTGEVTYVDAGYNILGMTGIE